MRKELEFPFDSEYILKKKKSIKNDLLEESNNFLCKNIAILGGSTTNDIKNIIELFLLNNGIKPSFYESEYNQYYQDAMFDNKTLEEFKPDIIYIHTTNKNITHYPDVSDSKETVDELINNEYQKFEEIWKSLKRRYNCPIIQNNFEWPMYRLMGNKEASDIHGKVNFIDKLNNKFYEYAQNSDNFYICDINYISSCYGLDKWHNEFYYHMYKYAMDINAIPYLSFNVANIIKSIFGKNKKGFVLDLDNTLWGGVIGDDGIEGIQIGPEESIGQAYSEFQRYLKEHKQVGAILNVDSKNDYENAIAGISHPDSELSQEDFISIKANWDPKDKNFVDIANEINLLPESLVFVDDNPAERHIITEQLKGVSAPEIGEVQDYIRNIDRNGYFEVTTLSKDDINRNQMYKENAERAKLEASFSNYHDYLLSLDMKAVIKTFEPIYYERISQLSNKSNQFNLTTKRYTVNEIEEIANNKEYITLYGKLIDKFGDNGLISAIIGHIVENVCHINLWIMSCRVLKRDMEFAMMDSLVKKCKENGINEIRGYYYPTAKNNMVKEFYLLQGFEKIKEDENGNTEWLFKINDDYTNKQDVINIIDEQ